VIVRRLLLARSFVVAAYLGGCATLAGVNDGNDGPASSSGGTDLPVRDGAAPLGEGGSDTDALVACKPGNAADSTSKLHASKVTADAPVVVNGDPAEWACVDRLDFSVGGRAVGAAAGHDVAEIAMQWDEQHLYFLARVTSDAPGGTAVGDQIFKNDSMHLFLAGPDPQPAAGYRASDHQMVFDYQSLVADYGGGLTRPSTAGITEKAGPFVSQNGVLTFTVEARIDASVIGRAGGLKAGDRVRVNFQINDNAAASYRTWFWESAVCTSFGTCNRSGVSEPYCDPHCTGEVELR
jgi:hypothetical protein